MDQKFFYEFILALGKETFGVPALSPEPPPALASALPVGGMRRKRKRKRNRPYGSEGGAGGEGFQFTYNERLHHLLDVTLQLLHHRLELDRPSPRIPTGCAGLQCFRPTHHPGVTRGHVSGTVSNVSIERDITTKSKRLQSLFFGVSSPCGPRPTLEVSVP